jgi:hypothetical protein
MVKSIFYLFSDLGFLKSLEIRVEYPHFCFLMSEIYHGTHHLSFDLMNCFPYKKQIFFKIRMVNKLLLVLYRGIIISQFKNVIQCVDIPHN